MILFHIFLNENFYPKSNLKLILINIKLQIHNYLLWKRTLNVNHIAKYIIKIGMSNY
jgi:hypothetical protein